MPAHRIPRWSSSELAVLREHYPALGGDCIEHLPGRSWTSVVQKAHKLGLRCKKAVIAPTARLTGEALEEAIVLREQQQWSFARIGAKFGLSEAAVCNAVLIALCPRKGFRAAERSASGCLLPEGKARLRYALKLGLKACDIQLRLGLSAGRIAEERRRYNAELKAAGKALLPPPGRGTSYSGVAVPRSLKAEIEALFLQGLGTKKISERTGASHTTITRVRTRLIKRLRRKGETLPGCDASGKRHKASESVAYIHPENIRVLREQLLEGVPVRRAAWFAAVGASTAYRQRDLLAAELKAQGERLPTPRLPGRCRKPGYRDDPLWPPATAADLIAFRGMLVDGTSFEQAREGWRERRRAERQAAREKELTYNRSFEEQLERIARGEIGISMAIPRAHLETTHLRHEEMPGARA
jgi:hypothetical protein